MLFTDSVTLENPHVRLEPLSPDHTDELAVAAVGLERAWYTAVPHPSRVADDIAQRLEWRDAGSMNAWAVRQLSTGRIVGETTFCNTDQPNRHVEIGRTWLTPAAQGTLVNPSAKLLLLRHAF